ncbi:MAG: hypothetical protein HYV03_01740, partial [Deltaproteobacteria bacterium]|nr:hypothetical protein [Deltaproteobacteria bacterium]
MTTLYLESSAAGAWLLGESTGRGVKTAIDRAHVVVCSALTLLETERALIRAELQRVITAADRQRLLGLLEQGAAQWHIMEITAEVRARDHDAVGRGLVEALGQHAAVGDDASLTAVKARESLA